MGRIKFLILIFIITNSCIFTIEINTGYYSIKTDDGYSLNSIYENSGNELNSFIKIVKYKDGFNLLTHEADKVFYFPKVLEEISVRSSSTFKNKEFNIYNITGDNYYIQHKITGLYLTKKKNDESIILSSLDNSLLQKWKINRIGPDTNHVYTFKSIQPNLGYFDVRGYFGPVNPGIYDNWDNIKGRMQLHNVIDGGTDQYIALHYAGNNEFFIQPLHGWVFWDVAGGRTSENNNLQLYELNRSGAQKFEFIPYVIGSNTYYYIKNKYSKKNINLHDGQLAISENNKIVWELDAYEKFRIPKNIDFYIKCAYSNKYWDIPGDGDETTTIGREIQMWESPNKFAKDRIYRIIPSKDHRWVYIQIQNNKDGVYYYADHGNSTNNGDKIKFSRGIKDGNYNKFAIELTSDKTFVIRTHTWKAVDISGGPAWNNNGADLIIWDPNYSRAQQFQLKGINQDLNNDSDVYRFKRSVSTN